MDDISDIREMYDAAWDRENIRLERHQLERDITWRYLDAYLPPPGARVLEVGSATGHYTFELARRGYVLTAVDLSPNMVARARARASELAMGDHIEFVVGDLRELTGIPTNAYDAALIMGPLYHLVLHEDRLMALRRVFEVLRPGGMMISSWLSRFGIMGDLMKNMPDWVFKREEVSSILERGRDLDWYRSHGSDEFRGYFCILSEVAQTHEEVGFNTLTVAGAEPAISADDESYNRLEGEIRRLWLDLLFSISTEPTMAASSRHLLYIGRKPL